MPASPRQLLHYLLDDDIDAALNAGLMDYAPQPGDAALDRQYPDLPQRLQQAQQRLRFAWAARERHRARAERLARHAAERQAQRAPAAAAAQVLARVQAKVRRQ